MNPHQDTRLTARKIEDKFGIEIRISHSRPSEWCESLPSSQEDPMTAIGITAPRTATLPATRLRLTARGRRVLTAVAALPAAAALAVAMISGGSALASRDTGAPVGSFQTVSGPSPKRSHPRPTRVTSSMRSPG
jgi:hypothetical protein